MPVKHLLKLFADESKLIAQIKNKLDIQNVQDDIDSLVDWAKEWRMAFNYEKCKTMIISKREFTTNNFNPVMSKDDGTFHTIKTKSERDLGVTLSEDLKWNEHVRKAVAKANSVLGMLKRTFTFWSIETFEILYTTYFRPHLEYGAPVWNPYRRKEINLLEKVQRRATKLVQSLKNFDYKTRLEKIGITTLNKRRHRGDLIQFF
ncbi:unnamed protein product [Brachionus calyciflorus]|uniref:RNA-directed DNA polymerase from mobile element jockey-like n=1 Tax=Brachionus calyciflorus TaxID=104777 RepID=A0A814KRI5_9BILA|nr:unnamed protein product [Brachionus calyciflorus]